MAHQNENVKAGNLTQPRKNGQQQRATVKPHNPWSPLYFARTLWLFTESDFLSFVGPNALYGLATALAGAPLTTTECPDLIHILVRFPRVVLWNYLVLLVSVLANQKSFEGAMEDAINKPWRPIPSSRITRDQARMLQLFTMPFGMGMNYFLGAWEETALVYNLAWMYNDLGGGDNWIIRNIILGLALSQFNKGGMRVAAEIQGVQIPESSWWWLFITSMILATTFQAQDMKDQEGDRARGGRTAPLVIGDTAARWTIAVPVMAWSFVCPLFWGLNWVGYVLPVGVGALVSARFVMLRGFWADKKTWWLWTFWTAIIWFVPLFKHYGVFVRFARRFGLEFAIERQSSGLQ
ncbi:hypothetical protein DPSP01_014155 [Paraphaeosphaeria sporulosa]